MANVELVVAMRFAAQQSLRDAVGIMGDDRPLVSKYGLAYAREIASEVIHEYLSHKGLGSLFIAQYGDVCGFEHDIVAETKEEALMKALQYMETEEFTKRAEEFSQRFDGMLRQLYEVRFGGLNQPIWDYFNGFLG